MQEHTPSGVRRGRALVVVAPRARFVALVHLLALLVAVVVTSPVSAGVRIREVQALNESTIADEDGDFSDWLELHNEGPGSVALDGWFLTDDASDLRRWRVPPVVLAESERLVVFASGKDRRDPGAELHANFRLDAGGEYLAIVRADGVTIEDEIAPRFPPQRADVSWGVATVAVEDQLVDLSTPTRWQVSSNTADLAWAASGYDDSAWQLGLLPFGYELGGGDVVGGGETINIAPDGVATQSSSLGGGFPASNAINLDLGDFTHTATGQGPAWWEIDLRARAAIDRVILHNRASCCGTRLRDITVSILDEGREEVWVSELLNPENELGAPALIEVDVSADAGGPVGGRYVRVTRTPDPDLSGTGGSGNADEPDVLSLAEVEVHELPVISFEPLIATDVEAELAGSAASLRLRSAFSIAPGGLPEGLRLRVRYDDGFIAYLNGVEVARRAAPDAVFASVEREDGAALRFLEIDLSDFVGTLVEGSNVLAVRALHASADDDDFLFEARLVGTSSERLEARYFRTPSPGEPESGETFIGYVDDTRFSVDRGFHDTAFDLEITSDTPGASIRYTLDGTPPTETRGTRYTGPITISRTSVVRAIAYLEGWEPTNVDTQSYLFVDDIVRQDYAATLDAGFPASWGGTSPDYGMDPDVIGQTGPDLFGGKYAATIRDDLRSIPTLSIVCDVDDLFGPNGIYTNSGSRGQQWERACSAELIHPDGEDGFQENCGIRIQGGAFRSHGLTRKHSLRLLFKAIYGDTKLRYALCGPEGPDEFDTITLRANSNDGYQWDGAGNRPLYIRDSFGRQTMLDMGGLASRETFVHLYLNGIYWGLYNPVERPDHSFSATHLGGDKDDWDAFSNGSFSNGTGAAWNEMLGFARAGLADNADYFGLLGRRPDGSDDPAVDELLDVDNLIDYMIVNLWVGNTDWPNKNYWAGRDRVRGVGFEFYMWDSEWSMGIRSELDTSRIDVNSGIAEPYAHCRANAEFRLRFADHLHRHFSEGGALWVDPSSPEWDPARPEANRPAARFVALAERVESAMVAESARWGDQHRSSPYTRDEQWRVERDRLLATYFPQRSAVVLSQFRSGGLYPSIDPPRVSPRGGFFEPGLVASVTASDGTVWLTLDGEDPRLVGGAVSPSAESGGDSDGAVLVSTGDTARVLVPSAADGGASWTDPDFDDSAWRTGPTGVGYERSSGYEALIGTDVEAETYDITSSVWIRVPFVVDDPSIFEFLTLDMKYDDGFVAWINGQRVAAVNAPASLGPSASATGSHADNQALVFESFDVSSAISALRVGENVLAIHGLNSSSTSSDLLILPELFGGRPGGTELVLERSTRVLARTQRGAEWSALEDVTFWVDTPIRITEIQYHPAPPDPGSPFDSGDYEFIELRNISGATVDLTDVRLDGAVRFDFTASGVTSLGPEEVVVVVRDLAGFADRYDLGAILVAGEYEGALANGGERIRLLGPLDAPLLDFTWDDAWLPETDGAGPSLVVVDPLAERESWGLAESWRASEFPLGSPGIDESGPGPTGGLRLPGDANGDGRLDVSDPIALLRFLFSGGGAPLPCGDGGATDPANVALLDHDGDGGLNVTDAIGALAFLFQGGAPPPGGTRCVRIDGCTSLCSR